MTAMIASNREQMVLLINTTIRTYFAEDVHSKDALEFCIFRKILPVFCCHVYFIGLLVNRKRKYPWRPILLYLRFDNIQSNNQYHSRFTPASNKLSLLCHLSYILLYFITGKILSRYIKMLTPAASICRASTWPYKCNIHNKISIEWIIVPNFMWRSI